MSRQIDNISWIRCVWSHILSAILQRTPPGLNALAMVSKKGLSTSSWAGPEKSNNFKQYSTYSIPWANAVRRQAYWDKGGWNNIRSCHTTSPRRNNKENKWKQCPSYISNYKCFEVVKHTVKLYITMSEITNVLQNNFGNQNNHKRKKEAKEE